MDPALALGWDVELSRAEREASMQIVRIGLDLAKYVFHLHGVDERGKVVLRKTRSAFNAAAIADEGAPAWMRTRTSFSSTSITAEPEFDDVGEEGAAGAGSMTTGANPRAFASAAWRISRRHLKTRLVQTSSRRATSAITAPGSEIAARIRARSSSLHRRRRSAPEITVIRPMLRS